jgi:hypothetical protein
LFLISIRDISAAAWVIGLMSEDFPRRALDAPPSPEPAPRRRRKMPAQAVRPARK